MLDKTEILLKVALNTITPLPQLSDFPPVFLIISKMLSKCSVVMEKKNSMWFSISGSLGSFG
jgi:hypothetical protein